MVQRLRQDPAFVPELSLVAETDGKLIGHILLTKITIEGAGDDWESLALAPVSVLPAYQSAGIGTQLIEAALKKAAEMRFKSVIVLGHEAYYPRFGFRPAKKWNIRAPFDVPDEAFMAVELEEGSLSGVSGTVRYSRPFSE